MTCNTAFDGRNPLIKAPIVGERPLVKNTLKLKKIFDGRQHLMNDIITGSVTFD